MRFFVDIVFINVFINKVFVFEFIFLVIVIWICRIENGFVLLEEGFGFRRCKFGYILFFCFRNYIVNKFFFEIIFYIFKFFYVDFIV